MIKIGNTGIVGVYKGSTPITSIYKGLDLVYKTGISYGKDDYVIKVQTTKAGQSVSIPLYTSQWLIYDWGDGSTVEERFNNSEANFAHSYSKPGTYYIILKYKYNPPTSQDYAFKASTSDMSKIIDIVHMPETPIISRSYLYNNSTDNYNPNLASNLAFKSNIESQSFYLYATDTSVNKEFTVQAKKYCDIKLKGAYTTLNALNYSPTDAHIDIDGSNVTEFKGFINWSKCPRSSNINGFKQLNKIEQIALPIYYPWQSYGNASILGDTQQNNNISYMYISNIGQYPCHYLFFNNPNWGDNTKGYPDAYDSLIRSLNDAVQVTTGDAYLHLGDAVYDRIPKDVRQSLRDKGYKLIEDVQWTPKTHITYERGSRFRISGSNRLSGVFTIKFNAPGTYTFKASMSGRWIEDQSGHYLKMYNLDSTTSLKVNINAPSDNKTVDNIKYVVPDDGQEHTARVEWSQGSRSEDITIEVSVYGY